MNKSGKKLALPDVLIVDDEEYNLDLLDRTLRDFCTIHRASGGQEALEIMPTLDDLAIIITDQRMPGITGTEMLRRAKIRRPNAVRLIVTGYSDPADLIDAINCSRVYHYVTKPFAPDYMRALIQRAVRLYRAGGESPVDDATGLPSRSALERELTRELARTHRSGNKGVVFSFMVSALPDQTERSSEDSVNLLGDSFLEKTMVELADNLNAQLRGGDLLASYSPRALVAVLPDCESIASTQERFNQQIESLTELQVARAQFPSAGLSINAIVYPTQATSLEQIFKLLKLSS